ncbi:MAG TPA: hypothetical protein VHO68_14850 [Bacteroidales bacterium]|nr:hypothetical protein [Bacteroidales bacterium]
MPSEKGKGLAGSALIHIIVFLLMIFLAFSIPEPPENEEGILVNFGTEETGLGMIEPSSPAYQETAPPPALAESMPSEDEPLLTQDDEEAPEVKKVDPEAEKKRLEKIEADRRLREQEQTERIQREQEEAEKKRIAAEEQRLADIMNKTKNALANSRNAGTSSTSEGIAGGTGNQGVPTGSVDSKVRGPGSGLGDNGITYDLGGRHSQKLPSPKYDYQEEGLVVVEVSVDREGKVLQATPGIKGSTTLDEYLLRVAKEAALEARFDADPNAPLIQKGSIRYNFVLK